MKTISLEEPGTGSREIGITEYLFVLMLLLYGGRSVTFFETLSIKDNPIGIFILVLFSGIMAFKWKLVFNMQFYALLFFFAIYFIAISLKYYVIQPTYIITYYILFFVTYTTVRTLKFNLFIIFEYLLFLFAGLSLFFWSLQVAMGGDTVFNIFSRFAFKPPVSEVSGQGLSAIFYTIQSYETMLINNARIARNCGFAWEPGSFAVFLCLGIFINLFMAKNSFNRKFRFAILLAALLTTQSTTGYVLLMIILIIYLIKKELKKVLLLLPAVIFAIVFFASLPFMKDKIVDLISETSEIDELLYQSYGRDRNVTPQRFTSLMITLEDFKNNPILGIAAHYDEQWTYKAGSRISTITGIGNLMAQFGLTGLLFFLFCLIKSSIYFSRYFSYRSALLLFLVITGITISYSITFVPIIMSFWMFAFFEPEILKEAGKESVPATESQSNI